MTDTPDTADDPEHSEESAVEAAGVAADPPARLELAPRPGDEAAKVEAEQVRNAVRADADSEWLESLTPSHDLLDRKDKEQDIELKRKYADWVLAALAVQLVVANAVFVAYAWVGKDWKLTANVVSVYFGATVAEVIGAVYVVMNYLFPRRDQGSGNE